MHAAFLTSPAPCNVPILSDLRGNNFPSYFQDFNYARISYLPMPHLLRRPLPGVFSPHRHGNARAILNIVWTPSSRHFIPPVRILRRMSQISQKGLVAGNRCIVQSGERLEPRVGPEPEEPVPET